MLNVAVLMGRLVATPELKHTKPGDVPFSSFSIAVDRDYKKEGDKRETDFIDIICWRHTAEFACKYFKKGQLIAVNGSIQTRTYTDTSGNKHKVFEVVADEVYGTGGKQESKTENQPEQTQQQ